MSDRLSILYTCDDAYLPLTGISIASVIENNQDRDLCFYIATESENSENYRKLVFHYLDDHRIEFRFLNCQKYDDLLNKKNFDKWGSDSFYVYWKLFAYDDIDEDEIWYLDSDVLCLNKIDKPVISKSIGAVLDSAHADFNRRAKMPENYYFFNTGSLFVDIRKWKDNKCTEKVLSYIEKMDHKPLMCDQDILSSALQDEIEVIDPKYDYLTGYDHYGIHNSFQMYSLNKKPFYTEKQVEEAKKNIIFYHCLGGVFGRPWQKGNGSPVKKEFEKYRELSAFSDYETEMNLSALFKIEKKLEILPSLIYNRIHNLAQRFYLWKISRN